MCPQVAACQKSWDISDGVFKMFEDVNFVECESSPLPHTLSSVQNLLQITLYAWNGSGFVIILHILYIYVQEEIDRQLVLDIWFRALGCIC